MSTQFNYTILILLIPLFTFAFTGLFGSRFKPIFSGILGTCTLGFITLLAYYTAYLYFFANSQVASGFPKIIPFNYLWLQFTDKLFISMGILLDPISVMMLVVITTVSFMVHVYSLGYMKGEEGFTRYYAFLSLFTFSMLGLVLATNIFQMYVFWELVGVSSYLLIGFYFKKPSAVAASKKAFIVTRFADLGFLIGILILSFYTGTFDFNLLTGSDHSIFSSGASVTFLGFSVFTWAAILIFMGGAGKSAMFPLHIWLPDAMEGPTPVSALIHAATMVVAGVYLVARLFPFYVFQAPDVLVVIGYIGAFTSLFAAIIACTQYDIKRVLAYSTLSQIGYMMLALGVSKYGEHEGLGFMASMFHLFTHAMFKALLFLGAGSIIHAVHSNSMQDMGGLRKYLPITHVTFLIACLTIAGMPFLSGFFSKDEILIAAFMHDKVLFGSAFLVAGITAFYMFRLYFNIFWNKETHYTHQPHESPFTMTIPLIILAFGSVFAGYLPFSRLVTSDSLPFETHLHWNIASASVGIGLAGIILAFLLYRRESLKPERITNALGSVYRTVYNKFYIDEIYLFVTKKIIFNLISRPVAWFDRHIVDGTMNGVAWVIEKTSYRIKGLQTGQVQQYGFVFALSSVGLVLLFLWLVVN
jgi:NADH-quinone oxidoreductase subunit L